MVYKYRIPAILDPFLDALKQNDIHTDYNDEFIAPFYHNPDIHLGLGFLDN